MIPHQPGLWTGSGQLPSPQGVDGKNWPNLWRTAVTRPIFEQRTGRPYEPVGARGRPGETLSGPGGGLCEVLGGLKGASEGAEEAWRRRGGKPRRESRGMRKAPPEVPEAPSWPAPAAGGRQPFLMRLVSSVTWL